MKRIGALFLASLLSLGCCAALAQSAPDPHVLGWYYNPEGGRYAHMVQRCPSVDEKYLPLQPLPEDMRETLYTPCPHCAQGAEPIFTAKGGSQNMPNLQIAVYPTTLTVPEWEGEQVYRLHITSQDQPASVFSDLLFPSMEGGDSLASLVRIEDMNFDGYPDIAALRIQGASNVTSTYFLFSPADGQFHYEPALDALSAYALYPAEGLISNSIHDSAATGIRELYRIGENGQPTLYRRASVLNDEQSNWEKIRITVTSYDLAGGETVLMDEVREPFADETDYQESERRWLGLFYEGIPEAVTQNEFGG